MKKSVAIVHLYTFFCVMFGFSQERISVLDGKLSFQRPENVLLHSEMPKMTQSGEMKYTDGKVVLGIVIEDEADLRKQYEIFEYNISIAIKNPRRERRGIEDFTLKSLRMRGNKSPAPPDLRPEGRGINPYRD